MPQAFMSKRKIVINPKYQALASSIGLLPKKAEKEGTVIYKGRNIIYRLPLENMEVTVKCFHVPALFNRFAYTYLRAGKAKRSYDNALRLEEMGVGTPEPVAYIEDYEGGLLKESFYICRMDEGSIIRHWETEVPDYKKMVSALGAFMFELHQKGIYHRDFSPGNILFTVDNGVYHFKLVDINRMRFGIHDKNTLYNNFRSLNIDSEEETARVGREYARAAHLDEKMMEDIAVGKLRAYHAEKARHRKLKKLLGK